MTISDNEFESLRQKNPADIFAAWFAAARESEPVNADAMTLATIGADGMPQARTVLLKSHSEAAFVFYTNSESRKGIALAHAPRAALLFYWKSLARQVSIEGDVRQMSADETLPYFQSRPRESRIGATASAQSRPLASLADFDAAFAAAREKHAGGDIPLPQYWRGFCLTARRMEFWREGKNRLHRRIAFARDSGGGGEWRATLLQP